MSKKGLTIQGNLTVEKTEGTTKGEIEVNKEEGENYKVNVQVEDEVKASIKITKKEEGTDTRIQGARFKLTGYELGENGRTLTTNTNGELTFNGLSVNQEYTLQEVKAEGYYLANPIKFKIVNNGGNYTLEKVQDETATGEIKEQATTEEEGIPTINIVIEDEKIPTYDLQLIKVKKTTESTISEDELIAKAEIALADTEVEYLAGAKFKLYKGTEEIGAYTTDETGKVTIEGLYQYETEKDIDQTYTLKEVLAPAGYAKVKDITFKVEEQDGALVLKEINEYGEEIAGENYTAEGNTIKLTIEDSPSFKLIKKDAETQSTIPNVKFAIYNVDNGEVPARDSKGEIIGTKETINGKEYYTISTDENGEITADLPEGLYKAVEVEAPEQYDISNSTYYFGIGASREAPTTMGVEFATSVGGSDYDYIYSVAETSDGGVIAGGYFQSRSIQVGDYTLTNSGSYDGMLIKYSREGEVEWARSVGGSSDDRITSVATTRDGGVIAGGYFQSRSIEVGDYTLMNSQGGNSDGMIIKYSSSGEVERARSVGGSRTDQITSVAETSDGGVIAGGYFNSDEIQVGDYTLTNSGSYDGMLIKYSASGEVEWARSVGGSNYDYINSVAETRDGGVIAGGYFYSSSIQVEDYTLTNSGNEDGMLIKYSATGEVEWARSVGGSNSDYIQSVATTEDGGYIAGGYFYSDEIQVGEYTLTNSGGRDGMIIKYSSTGEVEWAISVGGDDYDYIYSVAETSDGGVIAGGYFQSRSIQVGDYTLTNSGSYDGMLIKYSREGEVEWARSVGGGSEDRITSVATTRDGGVIAGGCFHSDKIQVGDYTLTKVGGYDGMVIKFKEKELVNVDITKAEGIGGSSDDGIESVVETSDGGYIAGGYFRSSSIQVGDYTLTNSRSGYYDGMLIKYSSSGEVEWARSVGGSDYDYIYSVASTSDGGVIAGGYFQSRSIQVGDYTLTKSGSTSYTDGMLIKYSREGEVEWARSVGGDDYDYIYSIAETIDGGAIAGGYFQSRSIQVGDYTLTNSSSTSYDGMIIKYGREGEVEWARSVGGSSNDRIESVAITRDGGVIAGGYFQSSSIQVGEYTLTRSGFSDGMIIKYSSTGEVEWAISVGGSSYDYIYSVASTRDGGVIAGGYFLSSSIQVGDYTLTNSGSYDGMIIKYSSEGEVEWARSVGGSSDDRITSVATTRDGGVIAGGYFYSSSIQVGDYTLTRSGSCDGMLIKYSSSGEVEWARSVGGSNTDQINSVSETADGGVIAGGYFESDEIEAGRFNLENKGEEDGLILKLQPNTGVPEIQELTVENTRKEFKITTDVKEIDGVKGGSISGEDKNPYEKVKYGENSTTEIKMTPDENYEIISITVNGQEYPFTANEDGTYTMPQFTNMTEDKHIEVTYVLKDNKLTINKVDSKTKTPLSGATFKIDQIEERTEPENVIGELTANGETYYDTDTTNEIPDVQGELTNNGTYYFVQNEDGTLTPTNGKTYQIANGGSTGIQSTTANSYIPIDLSSLEGQYVVVVNAKISSENNYDYGYATITETTTAPAYNTSTNGFVYISGTSSSVTTAKDYTSIALEGGKTYYLHLGYRKDSSGDSGDDQVVFNSIKVYKANTTTYNFIDNGEGGYESNNQGQDSTVANSYIPIDLTNNTGKYNLTVNAKISSQSSDYGYATVTTTTDRVAYNTNTTNQVRFVYISGEQDAQDYTTVLQGGQMYYLHLGYYKDSSTSSGDDKFTINSIKLTLNNSELYHTEVTTDSKGQGIVQLPFGKYQITETKAPEGYELNEEPTVIEFRADGDNHEITIENQEKAKVIVHHYLKDNEGQYTTTKVAEDELLEGKIGTEYTTTPHLDLQKYELEKDENGNYVIPEKAKGSYESGTIEIRYYYEEKEYPLIVHHYIEGTTEQVPLATGEKAQDENYQGKEGEKYSTQAIPDEELDSKYELVETPENATGTYTTDETIVTYYYKLAQRPLTIIKLGENTEVLEGIKFTIKNTETQETNEYTTDSQGKITVTLPVGEYEITETETRDDYALPENSTQTIQITKEKENYELTIDNEKKQGTVITHYYIEGTEEKVPSNIEGQVVEDVIQTGKVGEIYATKEAENVSTKYKLVEVVGNTSGEYTEETQEIIYYYKLNEGTVLVHHYKENTTESLSPDETMTGEVGSQYETNPAKDIPANYEVVAIPKNATGEIVEGQTVVTYYYRLKIPDILNPQITKESNVEKVTEPTQEINYTINYQTTIDKYIGEATVTITDKLPYEIDEAKSNIAGGTYNAVEKTITWEEIIKDIDTFTNETKEIKITKELTLVYKDLDVTQEKVTNEVTGTVNLKTPEKEQTVEDTEEIPAEYLVNIPVTKVWDDSNNVAKKRPEKITIKLTGNGQEYTQELTQANTDSQDSNRWTYTFTGLPRYDENGEEIDYIVSENPTGSIFYTEGNSKAEQGTKIITNTFEVPDEKTQVQVNKVWNDNNNVANKRPANITVVVEGDQNPTLPGNEVSKEYTLTETNAGTNTNEWTYTFNDLPKYDIYGNEITYTVTEKATGSIFYTAQNTKVTGNQTAGFTVTNTFEVPNETVDVPVTKIWADNSNEANKRPTNVTVTVEGDQNPTQSGNEVSKEYTLTEANKNADNTNEWTYTFEDSPKYDIYGNEIEYTINEKGTNSEFYQKTSVNQEARTITNTFVVPGDQITIPVEKVWQDSDNKANKRPTSVTIQVKNGNEVAAEEVLSEANNWSYEFKVPKYDDLGKEITYTVAEKDLNNIFYTTQNTKVTGNQTAGFTVTNTFEVPDEEVGVPVTKVWNDNNNIAQKRSEEITVILEGDQNPETEGNEIRKEYTLTETNKNESNTNEWKYTFEDLPKYDTYGNEIEYTVKEESTGSIFYTESNTNITGNTKTGYTITNTFEVPDTKIMVLVSKIWDDSNNVANKRPTTVKVILTGTPTIGEKITKEAELTIQDVNAEDENRWDYIFENLQKYDANGNEIVYTVEEQDLNNIFYAQENTKVTGTQTEGYVITNTFEVPNDTVKVPVTKVWNDNNNIAQKRPEKVTVIVEGDQNPTQDGNEVSKEYTLTEANKKQDNENEWTYTFEDLPKYDINGNEIKYTVTEKATGSIFYTEENTEVTGDQEQGYRITNTFEVPDETIDVPVTKIWADNNNEANNRPENVTITIEGDQDPTQEGNEVSKEYTLTEANKNASNTNEWTYTFEDLPKYDIYGNEIEYTIDEKDTNSEFYQKTSVNQEERTITNSFIVPGDTIEIPVTKIWEDNGNKANKRPEKVTLVLSGNGIDYEQTLTVSNANTLDNSKWEYTFTNLPKYDANGDEIEYILSEKDLNNKFYTTENTQINQEEKTVTNTFKVPDEKVEITVNKIWEDNEIQEQRRPESIILVVKNGSVEVARQEINSSNEVSGNKDNWQFTFTNLPKYDANGDEIEYTVDELEKTANDLHFYDKNISEITNVEETTNEEAKNKKQATITNTFKTPDDTTNITVNKIWNDNETQSSRRPESIIIMVKNGEETVQEKEISKANALQGKENQWTVTFEGLPKYDENGQEIRYTVDEKEKSTNDLYFYDKEITEVQDNQATIRNTFKKPEDTTNVTVTKTWEDNNNENNKRPTAIKVEVKAEGQTVKEQIINKTNEVSGNSNEWRYTFEDLPKYNEDGEEIEYTVEERAIGENDLEFYDKAKITGDMETGYTITNTFKVPDTKISVTVNKTWVDNEIQEQRRPESVVLVLKAKDNETEIARQEITLSNAISGNKDKWQYTFENLPKYDENGNVIEYTVEEQEKAEGDLHFYNTQIGAMVDKVEEGEKTGDKEVTITNTFTRPEDQTEVVITKIWNDNNNEAEKRPESIKLQLKNGNSTIKEQEVTEANATQGDTNKWQYTFTGIQKYDENGQELKYTADETEVHSSDLQFYTKEIQGTTVINKFTQNTDKTSVTVTKKWVDNEVQEQRSPESIIIQVKNGMEVVASYEMTEADKLDNDKDTWQYTFENLPKYDAFNNIINYTVDEAEKASGDLSFYSKEISGTTITNTFVKPQDKIEITVNKEWVDQDDVYKKRPDTINLQVKNGEEVIAEKTVSKEDNWEYTFTNLDKYDENGQEITYTVDEEETQTGDLFYYEKEIGEVINKEGTESGNNTSDNKENTTTTSRTTENTKQATITNKMNKLPSLVIVKYVDINTDEEIEDRVNKEGIVGDPFDVTEDKKDIPGYTLVEEPEEKTGTYTEETQVKTYYYAKNTKVIVKYLEKDDTPEDDADNKVLSEQITIEGYEGKPYSTEKKTIEDYTYVESKGKTSGKMEEDTIEVVYYYAPNTKVIVKYLEKDNTPNDNTDNKVLAPEETIDGYVGEKYDTEEKTITNYTFIESTDNTEGTMTKDTIEVIYYYAQNTKVTVKYLEQGTNKELAKEETIEGYEGQEYKTKQKDIEDYVFVESTNNTEGTMTKDEIEVIYYYAQKTKAKVEHIDRETGEILKEETKEGKVGDIFETHPEDFEGYVLVESPKEPNITMDKTGEQVVKYYYAHISAGVIEKHIDEKTGELLYSEEHKGNEGDSYDIPSRNFDGYDLLEKDKDGTNRLPTNAKGEMTKEVIEVKYYYIKKATVRIEYIDKETGEKLTEDETIEGHEGDPYETEEKEFKDYKLVETPENAKGEMTVTKNEDGTWNRETVVIYYYEKEKKDTTVVEKHIDINTGKVLAEETHKGKVGDEYDIPSREFEGYELVTEDKEGNNMLPENSKGTMTEKEIEVIYYYEKEAKVKVEYIDKQTGEKLDEEEIKGHVGDPYETEEKEFDGYELVEVPSNSEGEMTEEEIVVKYYYQRKAEVEVQYLEKDTNYKLAENDNITGYVGDKYETKAKDIPYYKLVDQTENTEGTMTKEKITVIYYYEKQLFNLSVDKWVSGTTINGIPQIAQNYNSRDELYKIDIHRSKVETAEVKITYTIRITNTGEIEGTADRITELIPQGYTYNQEDNSIYWQESNGILTTDALKDEMIKPGEYKDIEIVLRWNKGENNFGQKDNTVILSSETNPAGYEDINEEDNSDKSQMLLTVATGLDSTDRVVVIGIIEIVLVISVGLLLSYKKKERKK